MTISTKTHSQLIIGGMSLGGTWDDQPLQRNDTSTAELVLNHCLSHNINCLDLADIYKFGKSEQAVGEVLAKHPRLKQQLFIQSKCGIKLAPEHGISHYDSSSKWITHSVEYILQRLNIEQLDRLLIHRPDPLTSFEAIADTLTQLSIEGKIASIGVSNMSVAQLTSLNRHLPDSLPICCNQLEINLSDTRWLDASVDFNTRNTNAEYQEIYNTLLYCQDNKIQIQAWGVLAQGKLSKAAESGATDECSVVLRELANKYQVSTTVIQLAWLNTLPFTIFPVVGTTNTTRLTDIAQHSTLVLERKDWYQLYIAARQQPLP